MSDERAPVLQWVGFFLAPAAFFVHLQVGYVLIPWACTTHQEIWTHIVGGVAVLVAGGGIAAAWAARARSRDAQPNGAPDDGAGALPRTRFLGDVGVGVSALMALILLAQWIAGYVITACR